MKYRYLGQSGLAVSNLCLGTATFGQKEWGCDADTSTDIMNAYTELGGVFIDTADKYGDTVAEQIIGKWLSTKNRDELVIATKGFFPTSESINCRGLSRKHLIAACEASLKRLQTDYIDLYQVHESDPQTPMEETMSALDTLVHEGKVRYVGCSNYPAWKVMKSANIAERAGSSRFISGQYLYNLLKRDIEAEVIPACNDSGMGIACWSPLSGGMLTGKYKDANQPAEGSRLAARTDISKGRYNKWYEKSAEILKKVVAIAECHSVSPAAVSLAWLLANECVATVIVGAKNTKQIIQNCEASDWTLPDEDRAALDDISRISHGNPYDINERISKGWFDEIL